MCVHGECEKLRARARVRRDKISGLTTLVKAVGNNVVLELEVTDIKQEVGEGKADECKV